MSISRTATHVCICVYDGIMWLLSNISQRSLVSLRYRIEETSRKDVANILFFPIFVFRNLWLSHLPHSLTGTGLLWAASSPGGEGGGDRLTAPSTKDRMANLKNIDDALRKRLWLTERPLYIFTDCTFDSLSLPQWHT